MSDHEMEVEVEEEFEISLFVKPGVFNEEKLPTKKDVLRRVCLAYEDKLADENKSESLESFVPNVTRELVIIWNKIPIPILSENGVSLKMNRLIGQYRKNKSNRDRHYYKRFLTECEELFDIARCKCTNGSCRCIAADKIPQHFVELISDQRDERNLRLSEYKADLISHQRDERRLRRSEFTVDSISGQCQADEPRLCLTEDTLPEEFFSNECEMSTSIQHRPTTSGSEYIPTVTSVESFENEEPQKRFYNTQRPMPNLATECDRYGVSNRLAAALVSAAFKDYDVKESGQPVIIDKNKIERERTVNREKMMEKRKCTGMITAFSFDGRSDETVIEHRTTDGAMHSRKIKEKHITVLKQPNSEFLGYVVDAPDETSRKKPAQLTAEYLLVFFRERDLDLTNLVIVSCDGEAKNTGKHDGILRTLEKLLETPLHWFVCLIHFFELCLRHMFEKIDKSRTTGPKTGTGTIRKAIEAMKEMEGVDMPVVNFTPIPFESGRLPPNIEKFKLSTDEKYLYEIGMAVSTGECSESLANKKVPPLHEARWLTKACRVLRFYITKEQPSKALQELTTFIMRVYIPAYFNVKHRYSCTYGSIHFFNVIKYSRYLPSHLFDVIKDTCSNNPYFAHSENLLLAMIYDKDPEIRKHGYRKILNSRETDESMELDGAENVRPYLHPRILFGCEFYHEMIDWDLEFTEPPFTRNIPLDELRMLAENGNIITNEIIKVPCHNQANERHVKLVTEVSSRYTTHQRREGAIAATLEGREKRAKFDSKKDFS